MIPSCCKCSHLANVHGHSRLTCRGALTKLKHEKDCIETTLPGYLPRPCIALPNQVTNRTWQAIASTMLWEGQALGAYRGLAIADPPGKTPGHGHGYLPGQVPLRTLLVLPFFVKSWATIWGLAAEFQDIGLTRSPEDRCARSRTCVTHASARM